MLIANQIETGICRDLLVILWISPTEVTGTRADMVNLTTTNGITLDDEFRNNEEQVLHQVA